MVFNRQSYGIETWLYAKNPSERLKTAKYKIIYNKVDLVLEEF